MNFDCQSSADGQYRNAETSGYEQMIDRQSEWDISHDYSLTVSFSDSRKVKKTLINNLSVKIQ